MVWCNVVGNGTATQMSAPLAWGIEAKWIDLEFALSEEEAARLLILIRWNCLGQLAGDRKRKE